MATFHPKDHLRVLRQHRITLAEWYVLSLIGTWPIPEESVPDTAASHSEGDVRGSINAVEAWQAMRSCVKKGLLTVVNKPYLELIRWELSEHPAIGPIYGLPKEGDMDFLPTGVRLHQEVHALLFPHDASTRHFVVEDPAPAFYFPTQAAIDATAAMRRLNHPGLTLGRPKAIGPWRVYWWHSYPEGYVIHARPVDAQAG